MPSRLARCVLLSPLSIAALCGLVWEHELFEYLIGIGGIDMVVAHRKRIRCVVVSVPADQDAWTARGVLAHEMVPDADPYVAQLIKRLQDEVRRERRAEALSRRTKFGPVNRLARSRSAMADLEIPWFDMPRDDDPLSEGGDGRDFGSENRDDTLPPR